MPIFASVAATIRVCFDWTPPIEHLPRMTAALGGKVEIYAKREDCNSGLAMGGNKLRKIEYIVPDAIASGADT
ncbi:hypothetical protein ACC758_39825, partial [Rhizobium ruizarguesonis]